MRATTASALFAAILGASAGCGDASDVPPYRPGPLIIPDAWPTDAVPTPDGQRES